MQWRSPGHSGADSNGGPDSHAGADGDPQTCAHS